MKILIVGGNKKWAIERHYITHLQELGAEVSLYNAPDIVFERHSKNIINKVLFKTGVYTGYREVNEGLVKAAETLEPDFILVFKGMEIYPSTLKKLKSRFILANYNPDHPFIIQSRGSGNENVRKSVGLFHLHFCYSRDLQKRIEKEFQIPTVYLPFGFELSELDYMHAAEEPETKKLCFLGNPDEIRVETIRAISDAGHSVDLYGHSWNKTNLNGRLNISIHDAVYGQEFWKCLRKYRIQLNIFRLHNEGSHNMRTFEIPAVGGVQLTPFSREQSDFFAEDREIFFFKNRSEMLDKVSGLLTETESRISSVRNQARTRSLDSGYTYKDRASIVFNTFLNMKVPA